MVGAAAWAVPVMSVATAVPAWAAASDATQVTLSVANNQLPAVGATQVVVTVRDPRGAALPGKAVNLLGPEGSVIAAANGTTNGSGQYSTTIDLAAPWALPGKTVTLTALSDGATGSLPVTVLGSNLILRASGGMSQSPRVFPSPVVDYAPLWGMAVLADGSVWNNAPNWQRMTNVSNAVQLSTSNAGADTVYVLRNDGRIVCWGVNNRGQLGDGTTNYRSSPGVFQGLTDVVQVASQAAGVHALKSDGTLWYQGTNGMGRGGVGPVAQMVPLTQVPLPRKAVQVVSWVGYTGAALLDDGTVYAWGRNDQGQLGDGTTTQQNTPVQVLGLHSITALVGATSYADYTGANYMALKNDGSVWSWGRNESGQLGYAGGNRSSIGQVPVTNVVQIAMSPSGSYALNDDGAVLAWGRTGLSIGTVTTPTVVPVARSVKKLLGIHGHGYGDGCSIITLT